MSTLTPHFKNILYSNYDAYREPLKVKFTNAGPDRKILPFSVQYLDGQTKGLICQAIVALIDQMDPQLLLGNGFISGFVLCLFLRGNMCYLKTFLTLPCHTSCPQELDDQDLDSEDLFPLLASMKYIKAQYVHQKDEAAYCYEALRWAPKININEGSIIKSKY